MGTKKFSVNWGRLKLAIYVSNWMFWACWEVVFFGVCALESEAHEKFFIGFLCEEWRLSLGGDNLFRGYNFKTIKSTWRFHPSHSPKNYRIRNNTWAPYQSSLSILVLTTVWMNTPSIVGPPSRVPWSNSQSYPFHPCPRNYRVQKKLASDAHCGYHETVVEKSRVRVPKIRSQLFQSSCLRNALCTQLTISTIYAFTWKFVSWNVCPAHMNPYLKPQKFSNKTKGVARCCPTMFFYHKTIKVPYHQQPQRSVKQPRIVHQEKRFRDSLKASLWNFVKANYQIYPGHIQIPKNLSRSSILKPHSYLQLLSYKTRLYHQ